MNSKLFLGKLKSVQLKFKKAHTAFIDHKQ